MLRIIALRPARRSSHYLIGDNVPNVDVLITVCNENVDVVLDTLRAACALDYPADRYRVYVCDDGDSVALRTACEVLATNIQNLVYTARTKGPLRDYKAGNLNHGLRFSGSTAPSSTVGSPSMTETNTMSFAQTQEGPAAPDSKATTLSGSPYPSLLDLSKHHRPWGEYVAGLDADMIPEPHWLRAILPHLMDETSMALACPPQVSRTLHCTDAKGKKLMNTLLMTDIWFHRHSTTSRQTILLRRKCLNSPASQKSLMMHLVMQTV